MIHADLNLICDVNAMFEKKKKKNQLPKSEHNCSGVWSILANTQG